VYDGSQDCASCEEKPVKPLGGNKTAIELFTIIANLGGNYEFQNLLAAGSIFPEICLDDIQRVATILAPAYNAAVRNVTIGKRNGNN
jgi:hypothetical protein